MKRTVILLSLIVLSGCSRPAVGDTPASTLPITTSNVSVAPMPLEGTISASPLTTPPAPVPKSEIPKNAPMDVNWLSPSKVEINNFHAGGTAEYSLVFHNSKETTTEQKIVTTVDNDTNGDIPLKSVLYKDSVQSILSITSNESSDKLVAESYNKTNNTIFVTGFTPNKVRVMTITYAPMTAYYVYARLPDNSSLVSANTALNWVTIQYPTMILAPMETVNNLVSVTMPENSTLPDKNFELWLGVTEKSQSGGTALSLELVSRWIFTLKDSSVK